MQITIHDNQMNKVGFLSNEVPGIPSFFNDAWHRYLAEGASTFSFSVNKFKNGFLQDYCQFLNDQAYISFTFEGVDQLFSVLTLEETDDIITLNCATLNLELRNEQANPLVNSSNHNIKWYFDTMGLISYSQISLGINEVSDLTRTISYDGQESKLARLLSVIGNFDAEFEFVTNLNDDGTLKSIILNIYKANDGVNIQGVGTWRNDVTLYFGKNISEVRRTIDRTQIFNATTVKGDDGLSWKNSEWSVKNEDGKEEFYKRKGDDTAYAPISAELYPSQIQSVSRDIWIRKDFETEYKNVNDMWGYALSQFKKYAYSLVTYEVNASSRLISQSVGDGQSLSIGDTVRIQDENFNIQTGGLILQARVSELEISFSNPSNNKLIFSNYVELESGISDDLEARLSQLIKDNTPYRSDITSTNGTQFKNGTGSTTLGAHVYFGSDATETIADSYEWSKDGTVVASAQTITIDASGVENKAVYGFKAMIGGKVVGSQSVTITNVDDGTAGLPGTDGRSVTAIEQKYQLTQTSARPAEPWENENWQTTLPQMTATNKYLWSMTRTTFNKSPLTQDVVEQKAVYGDKGDDGSKGDPSKVVSDTEPTIRFEGLTWKYSGVADLTASDGTIIKPNTEYYFNGNHWMVNYLSVNNIEANSITADLINAKNLTITDGEFVSKTTQGFVTISTEIKDNHISISKDDSASDILNSITLDPEQGLAMAYLNRSTGDNRGVGVNFQGLFTNDNAGNYAQLTPQGTKLSTDVPWTSLSPTGGFNGGSIQFSVQNGVAYFSVSALGVPAMTANNWYQCAQLPTGSSAIPSVNKVTTAFGNASVWGFYVSRSGGLFFQCKSNVSATGNLANALAAFPIG